MPSLRVTVLTEDLRQGLDQIRREFEVPAEFPSGVEEAAAAELAGRSSPDRRRRRDKRHLPLFTIDPPGSGDLDQAFFARRLRKGYRVHYAIADVAAFVCPDGVVDREAWRRGQTLYMPDRRAPLYPPVLSEGAASLLPESDRPALLWTIDLDEDGDVTGSLLEPALVRSRRALTYDGAQSAIDSERADETLQLLRDIGQLREQHERERDGISLNLPTREVTPAPGGYRFRYEAPLAVERWNAQISLLAGHCAARIMVNGGVGILRALPPVPRHTLAKLRRVAGALDIDWPEGASLGDVVRTQDGRSPKSTAFLTQTTHSLRGAGYELVGETGRPPSVHGGLGMIYAHVTAPLRRLADRYANEVLVALCVGRTPPAWVTDALPRLPEAMAESDGRSDAVEAAVINLMESVVLASQVGRKFAATVIDFGHERATIQLRDPPIVAKIDERDVALGDRIEVRLAATNTQERDVKFVLA
jgi:exoribonuclease R